MEDIATPAGPVAAALQASASPTVVTPIAASGYPWLATKKDYLPAADETVDGWVQAANSSNVRTTQKIIKSLAPKAKVVIDPFVGAGSSAVAARLLGMPFYGIELDAVSAAVTAAKALGRARHAKLLAKQPVGHGFDQLLGLVADCHRRFRAQDAFVLSCLALVAEVRTEVRAAAGSPADLRKLMLDDLRNLDTPYLARLRELLTRCFPWWSVHSQVVWGDATQEAAWMSLGQVKKDVVIYTSPPFGPSSPRFQLPPVAHEAALEIMTHCGYDRRPAEPVAFGSYAELTLGMLEQAVRHIERGTVILEHEPADDGKDVRVELADRIREQYSSRKDGVRILESRAFSRRGRLSLIVCEIGR